MQIYLVGGAVRDQLLNIPSHEKDWVVLGATPEKMLVEGYQQVGKDFPVFLHPETKEEYALARTERKSGRGYTGFVCHSEPHVSLEEDLQRRDLTINAIARSPQGTLIDPFGGQQDLANRQLKHVSAAFIEDPLRILRIARFRAKLHALGFTIAAETQDLLQKMVKNGELSDLPVERIWLETEKALRTNNPEVYFQTLREIGAHEELFPEHNRLFGIPSGAVTQPSIDCGQVSLMTLASACALTDDIYLRFSALLHNLNAGLLEPSQWLTPIDNTSEVPLQHLRQRYRLPKQCAELAKLLITHHATIHRATDLSAAELIQLLEKLDAYRRPQRFAEVLLIAGLIKPLTEELVPAQACAYLEQAYQVSKEIKPTVNKAVCSGVEIGEQIRQLKVAAIEACLKP
jgi:tRNA nucleotidyltransferase (CCA-adding enzyme)